MTMCTGVAMNSNADRWACDTSVALAARARENAAIGRRARSQLDDHTLVPEVGDRCIAF